MSEIAHLLKRLSKPELAERMRHQSFWNAIHRALSNEADAVHLLKGPALPGPSGSPVKLLTVPLHKDLDLSLIATNGSRYISSLHIMHVLNFYFKACGRCVCNRGKIEEGVYSDLRKAQSAITLENRDLLSFLCENRCVRSRRLQKIYDLRSVQFDQFIQNALGRDLTRERLGKASVLTVDIDPVSHDSRFPSYLGTQSHQSLEHIFSLAINPSQSTSSAHERSFPYSSALQQLPGRSSSGLDYDHDPGTAAGAQGLPYWSIQHSSHNNVLRVDSGLSTFHHQQQPDILLSQVVTCSSWPTQQRSLVQQPIVQSKAGTHPHPLVTASGVAQSAPVVRSSGSLFRSSRTTQTASVNKKAPSRCAYPGCGRSFARSDHLKRHEFCHTGARPFKCYHAGCERSFSRKDNLLQHQQIHSGQPNPRRKGYRSSRGSGEGHAGDQI